MSADVIDQAGQSGQYTRAHYPELCKTCPHHGDSFDPKRHAELPSGNTNPASTACDYCCVWADGIPDHVPCSQCGTPGYLRRLKYAIQCDNCHKVHQHLDPKCARLRVKQTKKIEADVKPSSNPNFWDVEWWGPNSYEPSATFMVNRGDIASIFCALHAHEKSFDCGLGEVYNTMEGKPMAEPTEQKNKTAEERLDEQMNEKPRTCAGCGKVTASLRCDCIQNKWLCDKCWEERSTAEKPAPTKKPSKKAPKRKPDNHSKPARNLPLAYQQKIYRETPEYPYEQWPVASEGEIDLWGAFGVRNLVRQEGWNNEQLIAALRKWDQEHPLEESKPGNKAEPEKKPEIKSGPVENCLLCRLPKVQGNYDGLSKCECAEMEPDSYRGLAGDRLYEIFAAHFKAFKTLLTPDERKLMNAIAEVLE